MFAEFLRGAGLSMEITTAPVKIIEKWTCVQPIFGFQNDWAIDMLRFGHFWYFWWKWV